MASKDAPAPDIMNVREIIEFAFGDFEKNAVNFKLVQTVLLLLARQLRLLERHVILEVGPLFVFPSDSILSVTEVKIHAAQKRKTKQGAAGAKPSVRKAKHGVARAQFDGKTGAGTGAAAKGKKTGRGTQSRSADKTSNEPTTSTDKTASSAEKSSTDKTTSSAKETSTDKTTSSAKETSTDKTTSSAKEASTDKTTSSAKETSTDKTTSSAKEASTDKTTSSAKETSTDKTTSSAKEASTDKTTSSAKETSTDKTTSSAKEASTDKTTSSAKETSTDKTTSSAKEASSDKTTSSAKEASTDKTTSSAKEASTDKTTSSAKETSTEKTTSSAKETSTDKTSSSAKKTSTDKTTSTDKRSRAKTTSTATDKPSSKTTSSDRTSTSRTTSSSKDAVGGQKRTDSFEETTKTPTPMASVSSLQYEKLLVVKKVPTSEARLGESVHGSKRTSQISVVTQEQFNKLADAVRQLQKKLLPVGTPGFPEHVELMQELRKGASLTDAMAALQLSARLEATEKFLTCLISLVTDLALRKPGVELDSEMQAYFGISATKERELGTSEASGIIESAPFEGAPLEGTPFKSELFEGDPFEGDSFEDDPSEDGRGTKRDPSQFGRDAKRAAYSVKTLEDVKGGKSMTAPSTEPVFAMSETAETEMTRAPSLTGSVPEAPYTGTTSNYITFSDLRYESRQMYKEMIKKVNAITVNTDKTAGSAYTLAVKLEAKLDSALHSSKRMDDLANAVRQYAEQINALDSGLSSQMTNYQDQLTQMIQDLENGLDTMAEVLGKSGEDTEVIDELHLHFTGLHAEIELMSFRQKKLKGAQNSIIYDLENLWREVEILRDTKSDREEVADALRDKAGINELNKLISLTQFDAARGDLQKRIRAAYDKFNNQEFIWQKAIDDMFKVLNSKADLIQLNSLKNEIHKYLNRIQDRMQLITDIVGERKSALFSKKVFRDTLCLSCGNPAHMNVDEPGKVPALPKFRSARRPAEGAEGESETKGGGDYGICYPNLPIPHPRDPRSHKCKRYCGGSHSVVTYGLNRALSGLVVKQITRTCNTAPGTDGKLYLMDEQTKKIPCLACNIPHPSPSSPEPQPQKQAPIDSIDEVGYISLTPSAHEITYH